MARYIDAEGLNLYDDLFMKGENRSGVWVRYRDFENLIKTAPTADVQEVKHGHWKECNNGYYECSVCLELTNELDRRGYPIGTSERGKLAHFCPYCGAKMERGGEDES